MKLSFVVLVYVGVSGGTWKMQKSGRTWAQWRKVFEKFEMFLRSKKQVCSSGTTPLILIPHSRVVIRNNVKRGGTGSGTVILGLFSHELELHCFVLFRVGYVYNSYVYVVSNMLHQVQLFLAMVHFTHASY